MSKPEDEKITVRVPKALRGMITKALKHGSYMNESDFVRTAIREKLTRMGITNSRDNL